MIIYIDNEFKCHITNDGSMHEIETTVFDNKCEKFIEGCRFVPTGETWEREDGVIFQGEMVSPWKSFQELDVSQREYEQELAKAARILLGEEL